MPPRRGRLLVPGSTPKVAHGAAAARQETGGGRRCSSASAAALSSPSSPRVGRHFSRATADTAAAHRHARAARARDVRRGRGVPHQRVPLRRGQVPRRVLPLRARQRHRLRALHGPRAAPRADARAQDQGQHGAVRLVRRRLRAARDRRAHGRHPPQRRRCVHSMCAIGAASSAAREAAPPRRRGRNMPMPPTEHIPLAKVDEHHKKVARHFFGGRVHGTACLPAWTPGRMQPD